jgi:hypothetical protein
MRHPISRSIVFAAALLGAVSLAPVAAFAQQRPSQPPAPAPVKPYKVVTVTAPAAMTDASFEAFRKQLAEIAKRKDRAALAAVVAQDFFWETETGNKADKKKPGIDNLAAAIGLNAKEPVGWDVLLGHSGDPTASALTERKGTFCAPADPQFNEKDLEELIKATGTDPSEWAFPAGTGLEIRGEAKKDAPVIEKLGMAFIRVLPIAAPPPQGQVPMLKVATPSGKTGFVSAEAVAPLGSDQICYVKDGGNWKINGYIGGGEQ